MSNGIQISQEGIPLHRAADYQKVLDDRWPFLDISHEQEFTLSKSSFPSATGWWIEKVLEHNLGYLPAFTYRNLSYSDNLGGAATSVDIIATKTAIYVRDLWNSGTPMTRLDMRGFLRVFACDITKEFEAPVEAVAAGIRVSPKKYGVKVIDPRNTNARMSSPEMSDFSMNTNAKALSIQQTGTKRPTGVNNELVITHRLGYPPTYFISQVQTPEFFALYTIYASPHPEQTVLYPMNDAVNNRNIATTTTLTIRGVQATLDPNGTWAYLLLKDPVEVAA